MTREKYITELNDTLSKESKAFYTNIWTGMKPEDLMNVFKRVFYLIPFTTLPRYKIACEIRDKSESDLSVSDIDVIISALLSGTISSEQIIDRVASFTNDNKLFDRFIDDCQLCADEFILLNERHQKLIKRKSDAAMSKAPMESKSSLAARLNQ